MGGHIYLESEGIGKGSTAVFVVKLGFPQRSGDPKLPFAPSAILPASQGRTNFSGLKVLVMAENGLVIFSFEFSPFILIMMMSFIFLDT